MSGGELLAADLKRFLIARAHEECFDLVGVAKPGAAEDQLPLLVAWLARGNAAGMDYLARDPAKRCDARALLPGCRSVVVGAMSYHFSDAAPGAGQVRIARYAQGEDYHHVLRERMTAVGEHLRSLAPAESYVVTVDTSPILEKAYAVAAGIGFRGRNTLVVNPAHGSHFLLALLLTTAQLPADATLNASCGDCDACLRACPTGALSAPGVLDARLCLSYLTTGSKEPLDQATDLHGWLFGCDACQEACPYNSRPLAGRERRLAPLRACSNLTPGQVCAMDESEFDRLLGGTAMHHRGLGNLQCAACCLAAAGSEGYAADDV